ncbi:MAG TPA: outer membrane protein assembly factor BamE [Caulobacteraceae bacterium]|jgi:outer membrane protein assembly factor BamE (lipoprotein component of BamABCDE complex)|nr:outer membrane protein assembly factor BamE [Caulobacteraceae bacterium]
MASKPLIVLAAVCLVGLGAGACAPTIAYNGFQAREDKPADVKVGVDTKSTVLARLGSASTVATFEPNIWFYISQMTNKVAYKNPKVQTREVVAITFGPDEKVVSVKTYGLKNGFQVAYNKNETPTRGRELSVLEQLLGNIGRGGMMPQENDPGQRPGQ